MLGTHSLISFAAASSGKYTGTMHNTLHIVKDWGFLPTAYWEILKYDEFGLLKDSF